ncbi:MAG: nucleoside phosphorylase [Oscillospiraceae bacterium]
MLLPGDPNRVEKMAAQWDEGAKLYTLSRRSAAAVGTYKGVELGAWSTGIGGPSAECTLTDLAARGTHTFIRVGTTGAIQEGIRIGDIIINDSNVRLDGTSHLYVRDEYPAAASYEVVLALVQACENLGLRYHVGTGCTCASFYTGQCRTSYGGYRPSHLDADFADLRQAGVLNFEMEGATVTTLSRIFGKRAGMRFRGGPAHHRRVGRNGRGRVQRLFCRCGGCPHSDRMGPEKSGAGEATPLPRTVRPPWTRL